MKCRLYRAYLGGEGVCGWLYSFTEYSPYGRFICFTVERPWFNNERVVSCIPEGSYKIKAIEDSPLLHKLGYQGRGWEICDVKNRSHILFHPGNSVSDSAGCILPVSKLTGADPIFGADSRRAYEKLSKEFNACSDPEILIDIMPTIVK